jgi:hypothetical protein
VLRSAGGSAGLAGAFHDFVNSVQSAANIKMFVTALGDREIAPNTLLTIDESGIAVEPLIGLVTGLAVEEAAVNSAGVPTHAGLMGVGSFASAQIKEGIAERKVEEKSQFQNTGFLHTLV